MKGRVMVLIIATMAVCFSVFAGVNGKAEAAEKSGETLFKEFCAPCHVDGGNIVNPKKTLHKKDLDANNIKTHNDIIKNMRNPGPGMTKFPEKVIPEKDARKIAEFILKTYDK